MLFVSPRFLFPADSGGKIRTAQILRGMKGKEFEIILASPATAKTVERFSAELKEVSDRFVFWPEKRNGALRRAARLYYLGSSVPVSVASDRCRIARRVIAEEVDAGVDVAVFDFPHSAVFRPRRVTAPTVMFTHNVEAEIFRRHADVAGGGLKGRIWTAQSKKMQRFERDVMQRFDSIVAVSERDAMQIRSEYGIVNVSTIPTGVDLTYFQYREPDRDHSVVFTGSMDWKANVDAVSYFMDEVWERLACEVAGVHMTVVGRAPPSSLVEKARRRTIEWSFTGFVPDVRPSVSGAAAYVIPLRVGGGTRIKVFEAMAMGCPIVSTSIGVEGLPVEEGMHYLRADSPAEFVDAVKALLTDRALRLRISRAAREFVEQKCSHERASARFSEICKEAMCAERVKTSA